MNVRSLFLSNKKLYLDVLSQYGLTVTSIFIPIVSLPLYIKYLGVEQWGVISFCTLIVSIISLIESGFGQNIIREFSGNNTIGVVLNDKTAVHLFKSVECIYCVFGLLSGIVVVALSSVITLKWLNVDKEYLSTTKTSVELIGVGLIFILPAMFYRSFSISQQNILKINNIIILHLIIRTSVSLLICKVTEDASYMLLWVVISYLIECIHRRMLVYSSFGEKIPQSIRFYFRIETWEMLIRSLKFSFAVILGALVVQMDKIIISKVGTIHDYAVFTIASTMSLSILQIIQPIVSIALPRVIVAYKSNHGNAMLKYMLLLFLASLLVSAVLFVFYIFWGHQVINFWLKNADGGENVCALMDILIIGSLINIISITGYVGWVARGYVKGIFIINGVSLLVSLIGIPHFYNKYGILGGCFGWISLNLITIFPSLLWLKDVFNLNGKERKC